MGVGGAVSVEWRRFRMLLVSGMLRDAMGMDGVWR